MKISDKLLDVLIRVTSHVFEGLEGVIKDICVYSNFLINSRDTRDRIIQNFSFLVL